MALPNTQPALPPEGMISDIEAQIISEQPQRLYPTNQNSNFGAIRGVIAAELSDAVQLLDELYNELFIPTSVGYLSRWEGQAGLPRAVAGFSDDHRRTLLLSRRARGPFTRKRVRDTVTKFIEDTFGTGVDFGAGGIPLVGAGVPLFSGISSIIGTFRVYEDVQAFAYSVWIQSTVTPDIAGLTRELTWLTPSGIAFTIDNTHADVLDYFRLVRNAQPIGYWRLGNANDSSGYAMNLTAAGGITVGGIASPGLLAANVAGANGATNFDGTDDALSITDVATNGLLDFSGQQPYSLEAWVTPNVLDASFRRIICKGNGTDEYNLLGNSGVGFKFERWVGGALLAPAYLPAAPNALHHIVGVYDGFQLMLYVDGVLRQTVADTRSAIDTTFDFAVGRQPGGGAGSFWKGSIDEAAVYNYALSPDVILDHYNTGRDVATY